LSTSAGFSEVVFIALDPVVSRNGSVLKRQTAARCGGE
jgi:hypothetical protein